MTTQTKARKFYRDYDVENKQVIVSSVADKSLALVYAPTLPEEFPNFYTASILAHGSSMLVNAIEAAIAGTTKTPGVSINQAFEIVSRNLLAPMLDGSHSVRIGAEPTAPATMADKYAYLLANLDKLSGFREENREKLTAKINEAWAITTTTETGRLTRKGFSDLCKAPAVKQLLDAEFAKPSDAFGLSDLL